MDDNEQSIRYNEDGQAILSSIKSKNIPAVDENGNYIIRSLNRDKKADLPHESKHNTEEKLSSDGMKNKQKHGKKHKSKNNKKNKKSHKKDGRKIKQDKDRINLKIKNTLFHQTESINDIIASRLHNIEIKNLSNDTDFVNIFMDLYNGYILYNADTNQWIWWTGKYWKADTDYSVYNYAVQTARILNKIVKTGNSDDSKSIVSYGNHVAIRNILEMAKSKCVCHTEDFDNKKHLVNVNNGTVNLKKQKLREHRPEDMITNFIPVDYNPYAIGIRFDDFILEICDSDEDLAEYIQAVYGYAFTGETNEQCFFIEKGNGSNGKSLLNEVVEDVAGCYTERVDFSLFQKKQSSSANSPSPELAKLKGKHIVFCSETDDNQLNEAKIKEITGGTKITARALYEKPFSYIPKFTIIFDGNNLPTIKGADYGIWRRIVVLPFNRTFNKDITLRDTLLKEREVILKWLIDGAYKYYNYGFPNCQAVKKATKEYQAEENTVASFVKHAIHENPDSKCSAKALYLSYEKYCTNCGSTPISIKAFKSAMIMQGYKNKRNNKGILWIGICPKDSTSE